VRYSHGDVLASGVHPRVWLPTLQENHSAGSPRRDGAEDKPTRTLHRITDDKTAPKNAFQTPPLLRRFPAGPQHDRTPFPLHPALTASASPALAAMRALMPSADAQVQCSLPPSPAKKGAASASAVAPAAARRRPRTLAELTAGDASFPEGALSLAQAIQEGGLMQWPLQWPLVGLRLQTHTRTALSRAACAARRPDVGSRSDAPPAAEGQRGGGPGAAHRRPGV
jgi:hypothetical protein